MTSAILKLAEDMFHKQSHPKPNMLSIKSEENEANKLSKSTSTRSLNESNERANANFVNRQSVEILKTLLETFLSECNEENTIRNKNVISSVFENARQENTNFQFYTNSTNNGKMKPNKYLKNSDYCNSYNDGDSHDDGDNDGCNYDDQKPQVNIDVFSVKLYDAILYFQTRKVCRKMLKYHLIDSHNIDRLSFPRTLSSFTSTYNDNNESTKIQYIELDQDTKPIDNIAKFETKKIETSNFKFDFISDYDPIEAEVILADEWHASNLDDKEAVINIEDCPTYKSQFTTISSILEKDDSISFENLMNDQMKPSELKFDSIKPIEAVKTNQKTNKNKSKSFYTSTIFQKPSLMIKRLFQRRNRSIKRKKREIPIHDCTHIQPESCLRSPEPIDQVQTIKEPTEMPQIPQKNSKVIDDIGFTEFDKDMDEGIFRTPPNKCLNYDEISIEFSV